VYLIMTCKECPFHFQVVRPNLWSERRQKTSEIHVILDYQLSYGRYDFFTATYYSFNMYNFSSYYGVIELILVNVGMSWLWKCTSLRVYFYSQRVSIFTNRPISSITLLLYSYSIHLLNFMPVCSKYSNNRRTLTYGKMCNIKYASLNCLIIK
jgi:hypothetical protein